MSALEMVIEQRDKHAETWRDKPDWFWFVSLMEEIIELGLALVGQHNHSPEHEMAQISSICINWIDKRKG